MSLRKWLAWLVALSPVAVMIGYLAAVNGLVKTLIVAVAIFVFSVVWISAVSYIINE